jgi:hypothetical protein
MFCMLRREIERHKWFESQKRGMDVGWDFAERDWLERHFPNWKLHQWKHALSESVDPGVLVFQESDGR